MGGSEASTISSRASRPSDSSMSCVIASPVAEDETPGEQRPAIHGDEEEDLEGKAHLARGERLHPEGQQDVGDDHVQHQEGKEHEEADLEGLLQLREDKGGD